MNRARSSTQGLTCMLFLLLTSFALLCVVVRASTRSHKSPAKRDYDHYSVGLDLTPSYGIAVVDFHNGTRPAVRVDADDGYKETMRKLSSYAACHLAPPYNDMGESWADLPRQLKRSTRKKLGLPASADVGQLAHMVQSLQQRVHEEVGEDFASALVTVPQLPALYQEDLLDACEYTDIKYVLHEDWMRPLFWETATAYAGYGLGLCSNFMNSTDCALEQRDMPSKPVMTISYTEDALKTSFAVVGSAFGVWEPPYRTRVNVNLGSRFAAGDDAYWSKVWSELCNLTDTNPGFPKPKQIVLIGDQTGADEFQHLVQKLAISYETRPDVFSGLAEMAAALGASEFRKRARYFHFPRRGRNVSMSSNASDEESDSTHLEF